MRTLKIWGGLCIIFALGFPQTQLTIYNHGQALVKETLDRSIPIGISELEVQDVAEALNPTSVKLTSTGDLQVLEQNYRYDLVDQNKLLKKYLDTEISIITQNEKKLTGKLLSYDNGTLVIQHRAGTDIVQRNFVESIRCPNPAERIYVRPTLSWRVRSDEGSQQKLELSYLTRNISWQAEYVAVLNQQDTQLELSSWINLNNQSGKDYEQTKLKVVAGDLNIARPESRAVEMADMVMMRTKAASVEERSFFEYHLYEIGFPVSVNNKEEKQIQWLEPTRIKTDKRFVYDGVSDEFQNASIKINFTNDAASGTGVALPGGVVRLFKADTDGALELVGEDRIDHISRDDPVTFEVGKAFDVKGKKEILERRSKSDRYREEDVRITLANRKDESVEIDVIQHMGYRNWEILKSSEPYQDLDASRSKFSVTVPGRDELILTYTVRERWK